MIIKISPVRSARLPRADLETMSGEGHFWFHAHWEQVLAQLGAPAA